MELSIKQSNTKNVKPSTEIWTENNNVGVVGMEIVIEVFGRNGIAVGEYVGTREEGVQRISQESEDGEEIETRRIFNRSRVSRRENLGKIMLTSIQYLRIAFYLVTENNDDFNESTLSDRIRI